VGGFFFFFFLKVKIYIFFLVFTMHHYYSDFVGTELHIDWPRAVTAKLDDALDGSQPLSVRVHAGYIFSLDM